MDIKFKDIIDKYENYIHLVSGLTEGDIFRNFYTSVDKDIIKNWIEDTFDQNSIKNDDISEMYRKEGNENFKKKNYNAALQSYNNSIMYAPHTSENFALALANRSAVFFVQNKFKSCAKDIRVCLAHDYPDSLKFKIYLRLINCYSSMIKFDEAERETDVLKNYLQNDTILTQIMKDEIYDEIRNIEAKISENKELCKNVEIIQKNDEEIVLPKIEENPNLAYASNLLSLQYDSNRGRFVIANSDIKTGDVLFVEKSFSFVPILKDASNQEYYCYYCFTSIDCPIPCKNCKTLFCGLECFQKSWDEYHRFECTGSCVDFWVNIGVSFLATRILILGATSGYQNVFSVSQTQVEQFGNRSFNYDYVCSLVNHVDKMEKSAIFPSVMSALIITTYLKEKTDFFEYVNNFLPKSDQNIPENNQNLDILMGSVLLKHVLQVIANASTIETVEKSFYDKFNSDQQISDNPFQTIGVGMYPSVCMMNHSCQTNISTFFINDYIIVKAQTDIKKNSEIYNSYGYDCYKHNTNFRKGELKKQHFFDCDCVGCTAPTMPELFNLGLSCQKCKGLSMPKDKDIYECVRCEHFFSSKNHMVHIQKSDKLFEKYRNTNNIEYLKSCLEVREKVLCKENFALYVTILEMQDFYGKNGDFHLWMKYTIRSIDLDQKISGENNFRSAMNLRLYLLILMRFLMSLSIHEKNDIRKKTLWEYIEQANSMFSKMKTIFLLHYDENKINFDEISNKFQDCLAVVSEIMSQNLYTNTLEDDMNELYFENFADQL